MFYIYVTQLHVQWFTDCILYIQKFILTIIDCYSILQEMFQENEWIPWYIIFKTALFNDIATTNDQSSLSLYITNPHTQILNLFKLHFTSGDTLHPMVANVSVIINGNI